MNATNHSVYDELIRRKKFDSFSRRSQEEEAFENLLSRWRCRNFYISTYGQQIKIKFFSIRYRDLDRWDRQGHRTILALSKAYRTLWSHTKGISIPEFPANYHFAQQVREWLDASGWVCAPRNARVGFCLLVSLVWVVLTVTIRTYEGPKPSSQNIAKMRVTEIIIDVSQ